MLFIVIDQRSEFTALASRLFRPETTGSEQAVERLKRLNPQVDPAAMLEPGTVLLVPEVPGVEREGVGVRDVEGDAFDAFQQHALASVEAVAGQVRERYKVLVPLATEMLLVLETDAVRAAQVSDPDLRPQVEAATAAFKQDQADAGAVEEMLKGLRDDVTAELEALVKLTR